jgi:lipopolysaccharide biosynthesis glycosyltransferase
MAFDANYSAHAGVALYSLLASNPGHSFDIVLLCSELPQTEIAKFARLGAQFPARIGVRTTDPKMWSALGTSKRITSATYFRFLLPSLFDPTVERVLYLDCDLIVDGDIAPLWETDLSGAVLAACREIGCEKTRSGPLGLRASHRYFNAGVMVIDLKAWRAEDVSRRAVDFLTRNRALAVYFDQDALNVCLQDRVTYLSCVWNFMPFLNFTRFQTDFPEIEAGRLKPVIVHFAGNAKPWLKTPESHPWVRRYWDWRGRSPWAAPSGGGITAT